MSIIIADTPAQFDEAVSKAGSSGLCVVDFHATWCAPCHAIAPHFEKLAKQYPGATFIKVDTDKNKSVASRFSISAMPTFIFLRGGKQVEMLRGANPSKLTSLVTSLSGPTPSGGWPTTGGQTLSGSKPSSNNSNTALPWNVSPLLVVSLIFFVAPYLIKKFVFGSE